jgi:hypothetical protein
MVTAVNGMSFEKTVAFVERWPTPISYWEDMKKRIEQASLGEEQGGDEAEGGRVPEKTRKGLGKRKRSTGETWVEEEAGKLSGTRGIKTALSRWAHRLAPILNSMFVVLAC